MATDTAVVTITVDATVDAVNDSATTQAGQPVTVNVLANDLVNGVPATLALLDGPPVILAVRPADAGTATVDPATGEVTFTPAEGFCGNVEIDYEIEKTCDDGCPVLTLMGNDPAYVTDEGFPDLPGFEFGNTDSFTLLQPGQEPGSGDGAEFTYDTEMGRYVLNTGGDTLECGPLAPGRTIVYRVDSTPPMFEVRCVDVDFPCEG